MSSELGNVFGLLASALVVFFLVPLQRFAERVEALEFGGGISDKERALLNRLHDSLSVSPNDADAMEHDLQAAGT